MAGQLLLAIKRGVLPLLCISKIKVPGSPSFNEICLEVVILIRGIGGILGPIVIVMTSLFMFFWGESCYCTSVGTLHPSFVMNNPISDGANSQPPQLEICSGQRLSVMTPKSPKIRGPCPPAPQKRRKSTSTPAGFLRPRRPSASGAIPCSWNISYQRRPPWTRRFPASRSSQWGWKCLSRCPAARPWPSNQPYKWDRPCTQC